MKTMSKLKILENLCQHGWLTSLADQSLEKVLYFEKEALEQRLDELNAEICLFEQKYEMTSEEFIEKFRDGVLGDSADYFEWSAIYDMANSQRKKIAALEGDIL